MGKTSASRNITNDEELRMVMVGKTGTGKSATGNTILGRKVFDSKFSPESLTVDCSKGRAVVDGQEVVVIDTPGLFDTRFDMKKTQTNVNHCISFSSPGPHIFLVVIKLDRFTDEEKQTVRMIQEIFGQAADKYSMVLFTGGDLLEDNNMTVEEFLDASSALQELVARCNGQYHVFNNNLKNQEARSQVTELLKKIRSIVRKNGGSHYTNEMFQEAERKIEELKQQILKEREEIRKAKEEIERKLQEEHEEEIRKIQCENEAKMKEMIRRLNEERERRLREEAQRRREEDERQRILEEREELQRRMTLERERKIRKEYEEKMDRIQREKQAKEKEIKRLNKEKEKRQTEEAQRMKEEADKAARAVAELRAKHKNKCVIQ